MDENRIAGIFGFRATAILRNIQRVLDDQMILYGCAADEVLLDDLFEHRGIAVRVPGSFGVDNRDGATRANPQTIRFGAEDPSLPGESQFVESAFQIIPSLQRTLFVATLRFGLVTTEKDVAAYLADLE